jgi:hypothetical protein
MKRALILAALVAFCAGAARAQIGRSVSVSAGTPEDHALAAIYAAPDGPDKVALLDKFMADFGSDKDLSLLGDQLYVQTYLAQKNYAKVYEYGDKGLANDPDNLSIVVNMIHAAEEQGDASKMFALGDKATAILARYKASTAPEGTPPEQWDRTKQENLAKSQNDINYIEYALMNAAYKTTDPTARAALFERYGVLFPDSPYASSVREQTAFAYQQAGNGPKMIDAAQKILIADPQNISMLVLLADYWSGAGKELEKATADAQKALELLPQAKKPDNMTDEQWQQQSSIQKGLAYTSLGQIYVVRGANAKAVDAFQKANPLLKADAYNYARNLYRLGFTLAKMQRIPEARNVLTEAVSLDTPWKTPAQETLDKIGGATKKAGARKAS